MLFRVGRLRMGEGVIFLNNAEERRRSVKTVKVVVIRFIHFWEQIMSMGYLLSLPSSFCIPCFSKLHICYHGKLLGYTWNPVCFGDFCEKMGKDGMFDW